MSTTSVPSNVLPFESAKWLASVDYPQSTKTRESGYATGSFEVIIESGKKGVHSDYHNTEDGEFVNRSEVSIEKNFSKTIAAPTVDDAIKFINDSNLLKVESAVTEDKPFFRVIVCNAVIIAETKPGKDMNEAAQNLFANKNFRAAYEKRLNRINYKG